MVPSNRRIGKPKLPPEVADAPSSPGPAGLGGPGPRRRRLVRSMAIARSLAGGLLVLIVSVAAAFGARTYITTSPRFAVSALAVSGARHRSAEQVTTGAGIAKGENIFSVDLDEARARLLNDPWIEDATLVRRLPGTVVVQVKEREAAAVVVLGDGYLSGRNGDIFKRLEPGDPADLPVITGLGDDRLAADVDAVRATIVRALDVAAEYDHAPLASRAPLQEVHVGADGSMSLVVGKEALMLALGGPPFRRKLDQAVRVIAELDRRGGRAAAIMLDNALRPERVVVRMR